MAMQLVHDHSMVSRLIAGLHGALSLENHVMFTHKMHDLTKVYDKTNSFYCSGNIN